jgi:hypothetical protein
METMVLRLKPETQNIGELRAKYNFDQYLDAKRAFPVLCRTRPATTMSDTCINGL